MAGGDGDDVVYGGDGNDANLDGGETIRVIKGNYEGERLTSYA